MGVHYCRAVLECRKGELVDNRKFLREEFGVYSAINRKPFCFGWMDEKWKWPLWKINPTDKHRKEEGKHLAWDIRNRQNHPVVYFWERKKMSERCKEKTVAIRMTEWGKGNWSWTEGVGGMKRDLLQRGCLDQLKHQMWYNPDMPALP